MGKDSQLSEKLQKPKSFPLEHFDIHNNYNIIQSIKEMHSNHSTTYTAIMGVAMYPIY